MLLDDVDGWLSDEEGRELMALAAGKEVLEIGSYCGRSTIFMARSAKAVTCIDLFTGKGCGGQDTYDEFVSNLYTHNARHRVTIVRGDSALEAPKLLPASFDLIFIDGSHDVESVRTDIRVSLPLLRSGGIMAFHDYKRPGDAGVTAAVDELLQHANLLRIVDTIAVVGGVR